jgi:hypothetical protein
MEIDPQQVGDRDRQGAAVPILHAKIAQHFYSLHLNKNFGLKLNPLKQQKKESSPIENSFP